MNVTLDNPASVAAPYGDRFAHVARIDVGDGALLFLAGQVGVDDDGTVVAPGDVTRRCRADLRSDRRHPDRARRHL